jgi:pre-rRNA-processing protein IPI3
MYSSWEAHYRKVTVLRFTPDGEALLSGSEDSGVAVWSVFRSARILITSYPHHAYLVLLFRLLDDAVQNEIPESYADLTDHTLPITDIFCGFGPFPSCRVLTASTDHCVKVCAIFLYHHIPVVADTLQQLWDLASKSLLTTFQFLHAITCIAWDVTERFFFAASSDGSIHQVNLFRTRIDKTGGRVAEAIGGAGVSDILSVGNEDPSASKRRIISVGCVTRSLRHSYNPTIQPYLTFLYREPVTALALSLTGALLLAGTAIGNVHVYDVPSHQLLRTINAHPGPGLAITYLATLLKPLDLVGHVHLGGDKDGGIPVRPILPFQRMREARSREAHEVTMILPHAQKVRLLARVYVYALFFCHSALLLLSKLPFFSALIEVSYVIDYRTDRSSRTSRSRPTRVRSFFATGNFSCGLDLHGMAAATTTTRFPRHERQTETDA